MIPKIIHYCWFGKNPKPDNTLKYIKSWHKFCPNYRIIEWNESNFDISINQYCKEAYEQQKWAFVSDVARLWAIYNYGGIYLDTDVEVIKPLDSLLTSSGFMGFESKEWVGTNIIAATKNNDIINELLQIYNSKKFVNLDGSFNMTTNVELITKFLHNEYSLNLNGLQQNLADFVIHPSEWFAPYDYITGKIKKTSNTYSIHWYSQTWIDINPVRRKISQWLHRIIGIKITNKIHKILK
jgi:mannosyltransferase OCH1-like enzyme